MLVEPKDTSLFDSVMFEYKHRIQTNQRAVLFAVCRGKISEGLDFADKYARLTIIIGMPNPNMKEARIDLKMEYQDRLSQCSYHNGCMNKWEWYHQQAPRAVNQAIGRVIRHCKDYGAILLCDAR